MVLKEWMVYILIICVLLYNDNLFVEWESLYYFLFVFKCYDILNVY